MLNNELDGSKKISLIGKTLGKHEPQCQNPMAFLIPPTAQAGRAGVGQMHELARGLQGQGIRASVFKPKEGSPLEVSEVLPIYERSVQEAGNHPDCVVLIGFGEGADLIARDFYKFYPVKMPRAAVLLSATVSPLFLNNLTCPYLLLHGRDDPQFQFQPYKRVIEAIHHHHARYGDVSTHYLFPGLGKDLSVQGKFAPEVAAQVSDWLRLALREGLRQQENAAGNAA